MDKFNLPLHFFWVVCIELGVSDRIYQPAAQKNLGCSFLKAEMAINWFCKLSPLLVYLLLLLLCAVLPSTSGAAAYLIAHKLFKYYDTPTVSMSLQDNSPKQKSKRYSVFLKHFHHIAPIISDDSVRVSWHEHYN